MNFINLVKNFIAAQSGKSDDASPPWLMLANSAIRTSKARKLRPTCWTANLPDSRAAGQPTGQPERSASNQGLRKLRFVKGNRSPWYSLICNKVGLAA